MQVEFTKPEGGGLGFALVGGTNGSMLRVKEICSGGVAEQDGRLRVGDILLEVTTHDKSRQFDYLCGGETSDPHYVYSR